MPPTFSSIFYLHLPSQPPARCSSKDWDQVTYGGLWGVQPYEAVAQPLNKARLLLPQTHNLE